MGDDEVDNDGGYDGEWAADKGSFSDGQLKPSLFQFSWFLFCCLVDNVLLLYKTKQI